MREKLTSFVTASILLLALAYAGFSQSGVAKKIDELVQPLARNGQFSGVIVASQNGTVIYEKAFGMANAELKAPNTLGSRIGIASITKPMTAIILARLIESQKLALDDKLSKFIPDFPNGEKITVEMLSQHRSGILHRVMPDDQETRPYSSAEMIEKIKASKLAFEPGTQRLYSSGGYTVLARVLEIASGMSYQQLLQKYIFEPAKMTDTVDWDGPAIIERRTQDYLCGERGFINAPVKDYSFLVGSGSVISTASDIHKFAAAVVDGTYGASAKASFVRSGQITSSGSTNGHRAYLELRDDKSYGFVILSNMGCGSFDFVQRGIAEILQGKELTTKTLTVPKLIPNPNKDLGEFTGRYKRTDGSEIEIVIRNGYLYSSDIKLHPVKPDCFFDFRYFGDACFVRDAAGKITSLRWTGVTFELIWTRV
ncbi:MAG TPA: serine hydrolase domain-containing protein [Pyrinomonadaceae bacterium]|nr:serine hydrolase domain-containing protein [Pyrinomonadaceae bacterium]